MLQRLKRWASAIKRDVAALFLAARDARTPLVARLLAGAVAAYALSPIDLIPDFVPVLGLLDDLVLVPLGIWCVVQLIPAALFAEFRARANGKKLAASRTAAVVIVLAWVGALALCAAWLAKLT